MALTVAAPPAGLRVR